MKTAPAPTDRKAATLFVCADGMRAAWSYRSVTSVPPRERWAWERVTRDGKEPDAIDTDDGPTVGAMLAQVEAASSCSVELWHCPDDPPEESSVVFIRALGFATWKGPTHGAALVAAMRALKEAK
jgi:hypothetical protein